MKEKLLNLMNNSYSPYYKFQTSAIVVTDDNHEFAGVNVENANGTSICAERNAIAAAIAAGYKKGNFKELYLMLCNNKIDWPCFACRQVIIEFFDLNDKIICLTKDGKEESHTVKELCPYPFTQDDLK